MGQKGYMIVPKGLKMDEKAKIEFLDLKSLLFSGIFFSGIEGYSPPLNGKSAKLFKNGPKRPYNSPKRAKNA